MNRRPSPQPVGVVLGDVRRALDRLDETFQRKRARIEASALPGESYECTAARLQGEAVKGSRPADPLSRPSIHTREPSEANAQSDFFIPMLYSVGVRDCRSIMDVATYRLSKKHRRAGEMIRYDLPDGYIEVSAGGHGMASVWDFDIVLMMVTHLTEATNRYREGKGEKPGKLFRSHVGDILKFTRRGDGSRQAEDVEAALDRLQGTTIKSMRKNGKFRTTEAEGLIARYRVLSRTDTEKIGSVEIVAPDWMYREVVDGKQPEVLTVHPDYFSIASGIGRYIYLLARRAAGRTEAKWSFATIYKRSGSTGSINKFTENLRKIIAADDLPGYTFKEEMGQSGLQLLMRNRSSDPALSDP